MNAFEFGEKCAISVERGGAASRALSSTIGHVGAFPVATMLSLRSHVNPTQIQGASGSYFDKNISPDDTRAQQHIQLAKDMERANPEELKDTLVYLGGPNLINEYKRLYKNPRVSLPGKLMAGLTLPISTLLTNFARGSAYHPGTDSVYLMGDKPGVLTHELGHAIDFNTGPVPEQKPGESNFKYWLRRQGRGLIRDAYGMGRAVPGIGGLLALPQEEAANRLSLENLQKAYAKDPDKLNKILHDRQKVLPAGMGTYAGGAASILAGPMAPLVQAPLAIAGGLGGKIYGLAQAHRRKGNYINKDVDADDPHGLNILKFEQPKDEKKKDKKDKDESEERRTKAASFLSSLNDYWNSYNNGFKDTYGIDIRLPHDRDAARQLLISAVVGGGVGAGRGFIWPGYIEKKDKKGRIVDKKRRSQWLGALEGAAWGTGSGILSNYAAQTLAQYNPEINKMLDAAKERVVGHQPSAPNNS